MMAARKGFAAMDEATKSRISRMGGKAAHANGKAHKFTPDEARAAGRLGGIVAQTNRAVAKARAEYEAGAEYREDPATPIDDETPDEVDPDTLRSPT